jgi:hypothetical protein
MAFMSGPEQAVSDETTKRQRTRRDTKRFLRSGDVEEDVDIRELSGKVGWGARCGYGGLQLRMTGGVWQRRS